ncbi:MAG: C13 family peptidase, partial [Caldilinea sp.]
DAKPVHSDGVPQEHRFESVADVDWVYFNTVEGEQYLVDAQGVNTDDVNLSIRLYTDCNSAMMPITNPSFSPSVRSQFRAPQTGRIYVRLENANKLVESMHSYRVSVRNLSASAQPGLLILVAGRLRTGDPLQSNINQIAIDTYNLFLEQGYEDKDIYLISADVLRNQDAPADVAEVRDAITTWAPSQGAGIERPVTIYMVDHGDADKFYLDGVRGQVITPDDLDSWLTELETARPGVRINIFYEACFSGSFIQEPQSISKAGRVIATSTTGQNLAYASRTGAKFSDLFLSGLRQGNSLLLSFENAAEPIRRNFLRQEPWLDDNGNGIPNDPGDGQEAARRGFNFAGTLSDTPLYDEQWPPYILPGEMTLSEISPGSPIRRIQAKVLFDLQHGDSIKDVWVEIYPPSFEPPANSREMVRSPLAACPLQAIGNDQFEAQCDGFTEFGEYQVIVYASSNGGLVAQPRGLKITLPEPATDKLYLPLVWGQTLQREFGQDSITSQPALPYTAVTDANGRYILDNLPAGSYVVVPNHSTYRLEPAFVNVTVAENQEINFSALLHFLTPTATGTPTATRTPMATGTPMATP